MKIAHLTASTFFGGPERQMLGLAQHLDCAIQTSFVSFSECGRCRAFLAEVHGAGFSGVELTQDTPRLWSAAAELADLLHGQGTRVLCCHGYKANVVGRMAARRLGIPAVAVSRGWTGENLRVRCYEALDRRHLRWMDHVVCVSHAQAAKVRRAGIAEERISVIHNAIDMQRFAEPDGAKLHQLQSWFGTPPARIIGAAGRLSSEKGFDVLVQAALDICRREPAAGIVLFGDGVLRPRLERAIAAAGLQDRVVLAGLRRDLDAFLPFFDALVLPSYTEGLPNVVLEAFAAGVPVVATTVGGTPELVESGVNGLLVAPGDAKALAAAVLEVVRSPRREVMGQRGRDKVAEQFSFDAQARHYEELLARWHTAPTPLIEEAVEC